MRMPKLDPRGVALASIVVLGACQADGITETDIAPSFAAGSSSTAGTTRYLVATRATPLPDMFATEINAAGGSVVGEIPEIGVAIVESSDSDFAATMGRHPEVATVVVDELLEFDDPTADAAPVDHGAAPGAAVFDFLTWGIDAVGAPAAWEAGNRGEGVRVAVLDAGINHTHPDLAGNIDFGLSTSFVPCIVSNCVGAYEDWRVTPGFYFNHGTHVAGTIAGTGAVGVTGVAPEADIVVVKVCTEFFNACFTSSIVEGIVYAGEIGADVANMSLGGLRRMRNDFLPFCRSLGIPTAICGQIARNFVTGQDDYVQRALLIYQRAFEYANQAGTSMVVAAGNNALDADTSKDIKLGFADFPHTIAVSALGPTGWCLDPSTSVDEPAYYTNTGRSVIDVSAPGGNFGGFFLGSPHTDPCTVGFLTRSSYVFDGVFSTIAGGWGWAQGTSMAAPHATGVAALLIAGVGGSMSPAALERALKEAAEDLGPPGHDDVYGAGRVTAGY